MRLAHNPVVVTRVRQRMEALDQTLTAQVAEIEAELAALVLPEEEQTGTGTMAEVTPEQAWAKSIARLQTIPGIGLLTALWIVVTTMNFTLCASAEQAAAYAGLVPMPRESGTSVYKRPCIGHTGNGRLRTALYLATLSAARYNPIIQPFYERLRLAGKPMKVARCAAARKLLLLAYALVKHQKDFDALYQQPHAA